MTSLLFSMYIFFNKEINLRFFLIALVFIMGNFLCNEKVRDPIDSEPDICGTNNPYPQRTMYIFPELTIDSQFESGNLQKAERVDNKTYNIYIAPDNLNTPQQTKHRVWFYFRVSRVNIPDDNDTHLVSFRIKNMDDMEINNYKNGMRPVYSAPSANGEWHYLPTPITDMKHDHEQ